MDELRREKQVSCRVKITEHYQIFLKSGLKKWHSGKQETDVIILSMVKLGMFHSKGL